MRVEDSRAISGLVVHLGLGNTTIQGSGAAHTVVARRFSSFQSGRQGRIRSLQQAEICEPSPSTVITNTPLRCCLTNGLAVL